MRDIKYIVVHCTATPQDAKIESIKKYWRDVKGWKQVGYHYIIEANGKINKLAEESEITNGVAGYNSASVHVCYIGGVDSKGNPIDNRTDSQKNAMKDILAELKMRYPDAEIKGHRDFPNIKKACPSFDVKKWLDNL